MLLLDIAVVAMRGDGVPVSAPAPRHQRKGLSRGRFSNVERLYDELCVKINPYPKKLVSYMTLARLSRLALGPRLGWLRVRVGSKDVKRAALNPLCHCRPNPARASPPAASGQQSSECTDRPVLGNAPPRRRRGPDPQPNRRKHVHIGLGLELG